MKNIWLWILGGVALIGALYLYGKRGTAGGTPSLVNPGTAGNPASWFAGWMGYSKNALASGTAASQGAFSLLTSLSNAFGMNDSGRSVGVSVGGSGQGGTASSGSGAGIPNASDQDLYAMNNTDMLAVDDSNPANAGGYDVPDDYTFD